MKNNRLSGFLLAMAALTPLSAKAANPKYAPGDLVLYFQQQGGANTVYVVLGEAATEFRGAATGPGAPDMLNIININSQLVAAFGANWAGDDTIYAGLAGVYTNTETPLAVNGDPGRTIYVSSPRQSVGTVGSASSQARNAATDNSMSAGSSGILAMNTPFANGPDQSAGVFPTATSNIDNQNPFLSEGIQGTAFAAFAGGVQQRGASGSFGSFGDVGEVEFALDLYRIYADTYNLDPSRLVGPLREGTFEGTVTVDATGVVSFLSQASGGSPSVTVDSITTGAGSSSGTKVTIAFTATGDVDVYASTDLQTWGTAIATDVPASPFIEDNLSNPKRFYVLVPAGTAYPPAP